jgi:2-polyprenyl-3-methyl-5-hydroxy-6-metoxy-1,4-benzoquinol methylase
MGNSALDLSSIEEGLRYPSLSRLSSVLKTRHRFVGDGVERGYLLFGDSWAKEFELVLNSLFPSAHSIESAAKGYAAFSMHSMRLQKAFERERAYRAKTYQQAACEVYLNDAHMMEEYLPGLLLSHFLWPHHFRQIQFFYSAFVQAMRVSQATSFVEIGIGTGLYSGLLLRELPQVHGLGLDISPSSMHFTEMQLNALGVSERFNVELRDVTSESLTNKVDWLVCVEVLEHLEDPVYFLRSLRDQMAPSGKAFITAALNAAHSDHIYLYRNSGEVQKHLIEAGFTLEQSFSSMAYAPPEPGVPVPEAAAFIVY